jgi:hypothetical protein
MARPRPVARDLAIRPANELREYHPDVQPSDAPAPRLEALAPWEAHIVP